MQDTCLKEKCPFLKLFDIPKEECPFYIKTTWDVMGTPTFLDDCAPQRSVIMQAMHHDMILGTQKDVEKLEKGTVKLTEAFVGVAVALNNNEDVRVTVNDRNLLDGIK